MGYVAPVTPFQYIQYGNRVAYSEERKRTFQPVKGTRPIFPAILHAKSEEEPSDMNKEEFVFTNSKYKNARVFLEQKLVSAPGITGKGMLLDQIT